MSGILWWLWGKRQFRKWLMSLQTSGVPIEVNHHSKAEYAEGPYGPTTLGEFIGMKDIFVARMIFDHKTGYTWDLDKHGKLMHGKIWSLKGSRTDTKRPIQIPFQYRAWFEEASDSAFIQAKMKM